MLIEITRACVMQQQVVPNLLVKGAQPQVRISAKPDQWQSVWVNPAHVIQLNAELDGNGQPTGRTVMSTLAGGQLVDMTMDKLAALMGNAVRHVSGAVSEFVRA